MFNHEAKMALVDLATDSGKGLSDKTISMFEREMEEFTNEEVIRACRKWLNNEQCKFFPRVAELKALMPKRKDVAQELSCAWWSVFGQYGGNWASITKDDMQKIGEYVAKFCFDKTHKFNPTEEQGSFLKFLGWERTLQENLI